MAEALKIHYARGHGHGCQMVTRWGMSERLGTISLGEREDPLAGTSLTTGART